MWARRNSDSDIFFTHGHTAQTFCDKSQSKPSFSFSMNDSTSQQNFPSNPQLWHNILLKLTWMSYFHPLTASSLRILWKDVVKPSRKNLWHSSLLVSRSVEMQQNLKLKLIAAHSNWNLIFWQNTYMQDINNLSGQHSFNPLTPKSA